MKTMNNETKISKAEAIGTLDEKAVYARMNNDAQIQVGAIAWTTWRSFDGLCTHLIDDTEYFFIKN